MIQIPIGDFIPAPEPEEIASGIIPKTIAIVVIRIGRKRDSPAKIRASSVLYPSLRFSFATSISKVAFVPTNLLPLRFSPFLEA